MLYVSYYDSPIGKITLGAREDVLVGAWFEGQKYYMDKIIEDFEEKKDLPVLDQAEYWLDRYFAGQDPDPEELPLAPAGSDFRKEVWLSPSEQGISEQSRTGGNPGSQCGTGAGNSERDGANRDGKSSGSVCSRDIRKSSLF